MGPVRSQQWLWKPGPSGHTPTPDCPQCHLWAPRGTFLLCTGWTKVKQWVTEPERPWLLPSPVAFRVLAAAPPARPTGEAGSGRPGWGVSVLTGCMGTGHCPLSHLSSARSQASRLGVGPLLPRSAVFTVRACLQSPVPGEVPMTPLLPPLPGILVSPKGRHRKPGQRQLRGDQPLLHRP